MVVLHVIWIIVGQWPTVLAVGAYGVCFDYTFSLLSYRFSFSPLSGILNHCVKGAVSTKQPINQQYYTNDSIISSGQPF